MKALSSFLCSATLLLSLPSQGPRAGVFEITAGDPRAVAPAWASEERAMFASADRAIGKYFDLFVHANGSTVVPNDSAGKMDDIVEGMSDFCRYGLIRRAPWLTQNLSNVWKYHYNDAVSKGWFSNGFYASIPIDVEHAGEFFMLLWGVLDLDPEDADLVEANRLLAERLRSSAWYNGSGRLLRAMAFDTYGPPDHEVAAGDFLFNTYYLTAPFLASLTTGMDRYRQWALEYGNSWRELASGNGDIPPWHVDSATRVIGPRTGGRWWRGDYLIDNGVVLGPGRYDYEYYGFIGAGRALSKWPVELTILNGGGDGFADVLKNFLPILFETRPDGLPTAYHSDSGWRRSGVSRGGVPPPSSNTWDSYIALLLARHAVLTSSPETLSLVRTFLGSPGAGRARDLCEWLEFAFDTHDTDRARYEFWRERVLMDAHYEALAALSPSQMPDTGDELSTWVRALASDGFLTGSASHGGRVWGAGSEAPIRYTAENGTPGLEPGLAALLTSIAPASLTLLLDNDSAGPLTQLLVAGHYGQHRFDTVTAGGSPSTVGDRYLRVRIPAHSTATLEITITPYAYTPSLPVHKDAFPSADLDYDGRVTSFDLGVLMHRYGSDFPPCDLDVDGDVDRDDVSILLAEWG